MIPTEINITFLGRLSLEINSSIVCAPITPVPLAALFKKTTSKKKKVGPTAINYDENEAICSTI